MYSAGAGVMAQWIKLLLERAVLHVRLPVQVPAPPPPVQLPADVAGKQMMAEEHESLPPMQETPVKFPDD